MEAYTEFALVYDELMNNIPYDEWADFTIRLLQKRGIKDTDIAEIGCGTGNFTLRLAAAGYSLMAVDNSEEMLSVAYEKAAETDYPVFFVQQDMRELELGRQFPCIVSFCDCVNYILKEDDLLEVFRRVRESLQDGGLFFFDFNTRYKYETVLEDCVIAENQDRVSFIWENHFFKEEGINEYDVTFFIREDSAGEDMYRKFEEIHQQKAYTREIVEKLLNEAGLTVLEAFDEYSDRPASAKSERICLLAGKETK